MICKSIIFDLDGTLIDSESQCETAWKAAIAEYRHVMTSDFYATLVGLSVEESATLILNNYPIPLSIDSLAKILTSKWETAWQNGAPAIPGMIELINLLDKNGILWGIATSSSRRYLDTMLAHHALVERCAGSAAGDEVEQSKPNPDVYLLAAERMGVLATDCLVVEDSVYGVTSAVSANMTVIAIPHTYTLKSDFSHAHFQLDSLTELHNNLNKFISL